jgi:predicted RNA-binding protein associated with RNAse of E/G family
MIVIAYVAGYWAGMRKITDKLHEILPFEEYRNIVHMLYVDVKNEEDK